jgi:hypothetical protein
LMPELCRTVRQNNRCHPRLTPMDGIPGNKGALNGHKKFQ